MPVYRVQRAKADACVARFEANGEEAVFAAVEGDNYVLITRRLGAVKSDNGGRMRFVPVEVGDDDAPRRVQ